MTDILGQALQKLTTPENPLPAEQPQVPTSTASPIVPTTQPITMEDSSVTVTAAKILEPNQVVDLPPTHRNPLQYLQEHRRQAAAIVIAACIAVFWFDDGSTSVNFNSAEGESAQADAAEEQLMLDEFDAIEVTPKREPAEPAEVATADPFSLTIPQMDSQGSQAQLSSQGSEHPLLHESIGDVRNQSAVQAESAGSLEFPAEHSSDNSPPAIPRSVRFTGRIQPLN